MLMNSVFGPSCLAFLKPSFCISGKLFGLCWVKKESINLTFSTQLLNTSQKWHERSEELSGDVGCKDGTVAGF